jgi:hypothetical protein
LCTTIKYLRGAAGIGLGTTIMYLRRTTIVAANSGLDTTIKYLVSQNAGTGNNWAKAHIPIKPGTNSDKPLCSVPALLK